MWPVSEYPDDRSLSAGVYIWLIRLGCVAVAAAAIWYALKVYGEALVKSASEFQSDPILAKHWEVVGLLALSGFAFCVALRIPFPRPRIAWTRLVFVVVALVPAFHLWLAFDHRLDDAPSWVLGPYWLDGWEVAHIGAVLAGVAFAAGIGARRAKH
jgi:hypothetical protein